MYIFKCVAQSRFGTPVLLDKRELVLTLSVGEARNARWLIQRSLWALHTAGEHSPERKLILPVHSSIIRSKWLVIVT